MTPDLQTAQEVRATDAVVTSPEQDPDLARLIELVERIGGHGEQPL